MDTIKKISIAELCTMTDREGLVLQGCGGNLQEWVDGINDLLTGEGILLKGDKFQNVSTFEYKGSIDLLFDMENVKLDIGKLAMWRLQSHESFGGTWLSDFLANRFGITEENQFKQKEKPDCPLIGQDNNIFNLMGIAARTLKKSGLGDQAKEMSERITGGGVDYYKALNIIQEYVNVTSVDDEEYDEDLDEEPDYGNDFDLS